MTTARKAVVLFFRRARFHDLPGPWPCGAVSRTHAVSFAYGQRHAVEIEAAKRVARAMGVVSHTILPLPLGQIRRLGPDRRHPGAQGPFQRGHGPTASRSPTWPARNTIFLSLALGVAEVLGAADIFIGVNALDYSGYPDCRPQFVAAFEAMANLAVKEAVEGRLRIRIRTPLLASVQGRHRAPGDGAGRGLFPDPFLLRPGPRRPGLRALRQLPAAGQGFCRGRPARPHALTPSGGRKEGERPPAAGGPEAFPAYCEKRFQADTAMGA